MTSTPLIAVIDPHAPAQVEELLEKFREGYKIISASGMHHEVVYVLLKVTE